MADVEPTSEIMEGTRTAVGALLAYRRGDMSGLDELVEVYSGNPRPLTTALFHLANVLAEKAARAEDRGGDDLLQEVAERLALKRGSTTNRSPDQKNDYPSQDRPNQTGRGELDPPAGDEVSDQASN